MSTIPCKLQDKCTKKDCKYSHEEPSRSSAVNTKICKFGENCRFKKCKFTHLTPPKRLNHVKPDFNHDVNCNRSDCFFNHPNGRVIDRAVNDDSATPFFATAATSTDDQHHHRMESPHSGTSSRSSSQSSSYSQTTERACRLGSKSQRIKRSFHHHHGRKIERIKTGRPNHVYQQTSITEINGAFEELLRIAKKHQASFDFDSNEEDEDEGEERVLDVLQENALKELRSQRNEFHLAINELEREFHSSISSIVGNRNNSLEPQQIKKQLERELKRWKACLPIYARRSDIIKKIRANQVLVLKADTGSGKSTQTVQYLCDAHFADDKQIICTQPRKLAARSLAVRVAEEYGCKVGEEIGFEVGGSRPTVSRKMKVKFVTDTLFLNEYQRDPMLQKYSVVIIDEAHERKIDTDIVFGIMKLCLRKRKDLKLIVMSATLDMKLLNDYFAKDFACDTLEVGGRTYPIEDTYLDEDIENYVQESVRKAVEIHKSCETGDILVFLTGQDEIDSALADLNQKLDKDKSYVGLPLHGKLTEEENARIFEVIPNKRKIIFSTNVAETSVTIDGIKHVIESGMVKEKMWDEKRKMQVLKIGQITKSSVKQRRGRAGRTSAGKCYHLYTIETYEAMDTCSRPEILCTQPTIALLKLKLLNIANVDTFEWLEPPSASSLQEARKTLDWLKALDTQDHLTDLGRDMARLDIDPKLTAMLYKGRELNCLSYALVLAGMLTVSQNVWWSSKDAKAKQLLTEARIAFSHEGSDHMTLVNVYRQWYTFSVANSKKEQNAWCKKNSINRKSLQMAQNFIEEKARQMKYEFTLTDEFNEDLTQRLLQCMTAGYFLNLAISNGPLRAGYQVISPFASSKNEPIIARVFQTSILCLNKSMPKYILFNEFLNLNETNYITVLSSIDPQWLSSASPQWFETINGRSLQTIAYTQYMFESIGMALLKAIVGKRNCRLNSLEKKTQAIIDVDYKQSTLAIWSHQAHLEMAKKIIKEVIHKEKHKLAIEAEEFQITGGTRVLMSAGAISQMILLKDEFIRIILTKLPATITEERIQSLCEPFGHIRQIDFIRQNEHGSCVAITYSTIKEAQQAFTNLNGYIENGREIVVSSACLKADVTTTKRNCRLKAIWYLTSSTGKARITFTKGTSAQRAYRVFEGLHYKSYYQLLTDLPTMKVVYYLCIHQHKAYAYFKSPQEAEDAVEKVASVASEYKLSLAVRKDQEKGTVFIQRLPSNFDEDDVRNYFKDCPGLQDVQIPRGGKGQQLIKPDDAADRICAIFNRYQSFQRTTVTFHPNIYNGRLEAYAEFLDVNELRHAIDEMNGKTGLIGSGKIRLSEFIQSKPKKQVMPGKKKDTEFVINLQKLDLSLDKYDLIKVLKDNELYDDVRSVIVFREKLGNNKLMSNTSEELELGFTSFRSLFISGKNMFYSVPEFHISPATTDGTVTALVLFRDPTDVAKAIQLYDNQRIQLSRGSSKLRLIPSMAHEIFINAALTKAISDKIQQTIAYIREKLQRAYIKSVSLKQTDKASTMKVFINGDDIQQITMAKIEFDNLMKGVAYTFVENPEKTRLLFDRTGTKELQLIQKDTGCYISWSQSNGFVRLYGSDRSVETARRHIDDYIKTKSKNEQKTIMLDIPSGYIRQILKASATYQEAIGNEFNVEITVLLFKRQIKLTGRRDDLIKCEESLKKYWSMMSIDTQVVSNHTMFAECPICCDTANYNLQACGHAYCLNCLRQQISTKFDTTLSNQTLEIICMTPQCNQPFLLRDIKMIIDFNDMPKLARASFQAYIKTNPDIAQCMGLDCRQVYRKSKHQQSYFCDSCLKFYCVKCQVEYHTGLTCKAYKFNLELKDEKKLTKFNIGNLNLKPCPSCKLIIDRYTGCNAVKCSCGISFCWLCGTSDPHDIHHHFGNHNSSCYNKCFTLT